jgi:UDP-N-acetylglucosamine:LPS N-acetylglucosamine transferase
MKRILILSASFGDGHNAAARSIRDTLELSGENVSAEVLDLFELASPRVNAVMKKAYQGIVRFAPSLWSRVFAVFDNPKLFEPQIRSMRKMRNALGDLLCKTNPDVVVSTYPVYSYFIAELFREKKRSFRLITVVTDSISVCAAWFHVPSDIFVVADEPTASVLREAGVDPDRIKPLGFPVSPLFTRGPKSAIATPANGVRPKVLYVINTGKSRAGHSLERLLHAQNLDLTITAGRNAALKARLTHRFCDYGSRVQVLGWTNQMPQLLMSHHLLIGKAGGATVQETIAAACPMIINQVIPGQEEGNARLIEMLGGGAVAGHIHEVPQLVENALADGARQWSAWRKNLQKASRPDSAARIADLILQNCAGSAGKPSLATEALQHPWPAGVHRA